MCYKTKLTKFAHFLNATGLFVVWVNMKNATLILGNGSRYSGKSFGYGKGVQGEVVFTTAMTGYPQSLTDPSYAGQILVFTSPLVGNYGVPPHTFGKEGLPDNFEGERIYPRAIVVSDYTEKPSHWNSVETLAQWLEREHIAGITEVDTRSLALELRQEGVMTGMIVIEGEQEQRLSDEYGSVNFVEEVSCNKVIRYNVGAGKRVVLVDCGVKVNIIRCLTGREVEVIRVPWNHDFTTMEYDGLVLSNGPGNPDTCSVVVENLRKAMSTGSKPIFGICLGNQLMAKAAGASVYKLPYGHRSHTQPVRMVGTTRCFITSQNHGYAVDSATLPAGWLPWFENMNDRSNEGIRHKSKPWFSVQFHPEAESGPLDTMFLFDEFVKML